MKTLLLLLAILSLTLTACSPKDEKKQDEKPQGVLSDAQKKTLDKAKKTEDMLDKANKERMKEVDDAERQL